MFCKVVGEVSYEVLDKVLGEILGKVVGEVLCELLGEVSEGGNTIPPNKTFYIRVHEDWHKNIATQMNEEKWIFQATFN